MVEKTDESTVELPLVTEGATKEVQPETVGEVKFTEADFNNLSEPEQVLAKKHGLFPEKKEEETKKEPEEKTDDKKTEGEEKAKPEEKKETKQVEEPEISEEDINKERGYKEEQDFRNKISKKQYGFYREMKNAKQKAKLVEEEAKNKDIKNDLLLKRIEALESQSKQQVKEPDDDRTYYDENGEVIEKRERVNPEDKPLTMKELIAFEKERDEKSNGEYQEQKELREMNDRLAAEAADSDKNFNEVIRMAREVMKADGSGVYASIVSLAGGYKNAPPESNIIAATYKIAQLHKDYQKVMAGDTKPGEEPKPEKTGEKLSKEDLQRVIDNSKEKSSAGLASRGKRLVNKKDLKVSDFGTSETSEIYKNLNKEDRERILLESCANADT